MSTSAAPERLEDYNNISVIDSPVEKRYIESETFDFKGRKAVKGNELSKDFCAMANTSGGTIVLGIEEIKKNDVLKGFKKDGFRIDADDEDKVKQVIGSNMYEVEPTQ
jgi:predicted HTH transcriptional regulator